MSNADTDKNAAIAMREVAQALANYLRLFPPADAIQALAYLAAILVLSIETDGPKVDAWDGVAAAIRSDISENVRLSLS